MTRFGRIALVSVAAGLLPAAPALADYDIMADPAFPSVVYIEFDPSTMPNIYSAPVGDPALPVIGGGVVNGDTGGASGNAAPAADTRRDKKTSQDNAELTPDDRAEQRVQELVSGGAEEIENIVIDREIEDRVLDGVDLNR
jgi:hypothetical protein